MNSEQIILKAAVDQGILSQEESDQASGGKTAVRSWGVMQVGHDPGCPTLQSQEPDTCTCEPFAVIMKRNQQWWWLGKEWRLQRDLTPADRARMLLTIYEATQ